MDTNVAQVTDHDFIAILPREFEAHIALNVIFDVILNNSNLLVWVVNVKVAIVVETHP
jgi:hypothetical protein